ncbi:MAG TPA: glycosyltransferase, partial [Nitrospirae bacterium]|nr:glycosyltransferase [Nitrospirota bacterium]
MDVFWFFAGITVIGLIACVLQIVAVRSHITSLNSGEGATLLRFFPPVSVLKPLKGIDDNLFDNLESFCVQDYPEFEVIFSLQDRNDPAYKVARKIKDKYPDRDISIVVRRCNDGLNPKVNNLIPAYRVSKYRYILISDSNVTVDKDYLREIVKPMEDAGVGLVSSMIKGVGGRTAGSIFENLHLNTFVVGSVCFLDKFLKMPCVVGKSMLMRKDDLEAIGGFKSVKDVLAEDYVIGKKMKEAGRKVVLSNYMINTVNKYWGMKNFLGRHTRWGKLRWKIGGIQYLSELLGNAVFMSFVPVVLYEPSRTTLSFALATSALKIMGDLYLGRMLKADIKSVFYLLSPVKDIAVGFMWFVPLLSSRVAWRGNRYVIGKASRLSPCPENSRWSW